MTRTIRTTAAAILALGPLVVVGPAHAFPDDAPPTPSPDSCAGTLARAQQWPGTVAADGIEYRVVSDAYVTYLAGLPACTDQVSSVVTDG